MPINNDWIKAGALIAALAVVVGGIDAETLVDLRIDFPTLTTNETKIERVSTEDASQSNQRSFQLAAFFQLAHALAIIAVGILLILQPGRLLKASAWCFLLGIIPVSYTHLTLPTKA